MLAEVSYDGSRPETTGSLFLLYVDRTWPEHRKQAGPLAHAAEDGVLAALGAMFAALTVGGRHGGGVRLHPHQRGHARLREDRHERAGRRGRARAPARQHLGPTPFEVHYAARVPHCRKVERNPHFVFGEYRKRSNREFFTIAPDLAKAIVELVAIQQETVSDREQGIAPVQREEIVEKEEARSARLSLASLGLAPGTVLTFSKDPAVTCIVAGPKTVVFRGEEQSLSAAALKAVRDMGYSWSRVNGFEYWSSVGIKLADLALLSPKDG